MINRYTYSFILLFSFISPAVFAQGFSPAEYEKALWMTTRFYGGQRSGDNNWLLHNHLPTGVSESLRGTAFIGDNDNGYDLSGGWHDCGDHVKFGQTEYYSAYLLLKGFAEFPEGYDDYYSYDYQGYKSSGKWSWEEGAHDPNGIPDILDEVKHATDYFIKCARNSSTFYYQVGDGGPDHAKWVTATKMQTLPVAEGGQTRKVYKNPADASMPSFCGASLALMSRLYRKYDPVYADLCLQHALYAYDYAKSHPGTVAADGGFYGANDNWKDDYATMCAELFWATGTASYKNEALSFSISVSPGQGADIYGKSQWVDYSNNGELAIYNLLLLGKTNAQSVFNQCVNNILGQTLTDGQFSGGNASWGPLRYNANTAFHVALWQKVNGTDNSVHQFIYDNIDYILGDNSANQSFIVGFGNNSVKFPHHRNVYLRDDNPGDAVKRTLTIPDKNKQFGLMVGGTRNPSQYSDDLVNYTHTEGGIDYNAGLVGALAYIRSVLAPVDTNKFGNTVPDLGADVSICGLTQLTLDSKVPVDGQKTFTWYKDDNMLFGASTTRNTISVSQAGKYTCVLDSAGQWSTQASVNVLGVLPDINLGSDVVLCDPAFVTLKTDITGSGIVYTWMKNGQILYGNGNSSLAVYSAGSYKLEISASGCPAKSDEVVVTSQLPEAMHDTICSPGVASLAITGDGGPYEWYTSESASSPVHTGNTYQPDINTSRTYYVQDGGSLSVTAGPSATNNSLVQSSNGGNIGIKFTAEKAFTITGLSVQPYIYNCPTDVVYVDFVLEKNGTQVGSYTTSKVNCNGSQTSAPWQTYQLVFETPVIVDGPGDYILTPSGGRQLPWYESGADFNQYDVAGVIDITGDTRNDRTNSFPAIFDLKIQSGSSCARTPVFAVIDAANAGCDVVTGIDKGFNAGIFTVYPNPSAESFKLKLVDSQNNDQVKVFDSLGRLVEVISVSENAEFGNALNAGMYHMIYYRNGEVIGSENLIKK